MNLAQNFVGSNNTNLLVPSGQFGTRLQGGKDSAVSELPWQFARLRGLVHSKDVKSTLSYVDPFSTELYRTTPQHATSIPGRSLENVWVLKPSRRLSQVTRVLFQQDDVCWRQTEAGGNMFLTSCAFSYA